MNESKRRAQILFLVGISSSIGVWIACVYLLTLLGFSQALAFIIAHTAAVATVGAFVYQIYRTVAAEREARNVEPRKKQACIILGAPNHGVLQDRVNYWLANEQGTVRSMTIAIANNGIYMAIIFELAGTRELTDKGMQLEEVTSKRSQRS